MKPRAIKSQSRRTTVLRCQAPALKHKRVATRLLRKTLRPGIERDTQLMPWVIADSVLQEAGCFLNVQLPLEWSDWLDQRAERCYARHKQFRQLVRRKGNTGRGYLYRFLRHWLAGKLEKTNTGLFRRLPYQYLLGGPLPSRG